MKKKKGFWAMIWESLTKTGGCCGSGESCCGPDKKIDKKINVNMEKKDECKKK